MAIGKMMTKQWISRRHIRQTHGATWCNTTGAKRREWMGCWGLLELLLIVIVDHSRKFPTFSTSKIMMVILVHLW